MDYIDLRSDTVTWPTPKMREAMANAVVGDDVYGEDPTVNQLEEEAAALLGKEAAVFVTSGTMGNQAAIMAHCERGSEMIAGKNAHIFVAEAGGAAALSGVQIYPLDVRDDGTMSLEDIRRAIRREDEHFPRTRLIALENTHAMSGGNPLPVSYIRQVADLAHENGLKLHIDGARLFNAAAALNIPAQELVASADSVTFCLSKGLCAPIGSMLCGSKDFIHEARRARKVMGGSLRQVGVIAAAGLVAIREMIDRLSEDHANACALAEGLAENRYIHIDPARVKTNILYFTLADDAPLSGKALSERLKADYNILMNPYFTSPKQFRCLTHYWISSEDIQTVIKAINALLQ